MVGINEARQREPQRQSVYWSPFGYDLPPENGFVIVKVLTQARVRSRDLFVVPNRINVVMPPSPQSAPELVSIKMLLVLW